VSTAEDVLQSLQPRLQEGKGKEYSLLVLVHFRDCSGGDEVNKCQAQARVYRVVLARPAQGCPGLVLTRDSTGGPLVNVIAAFTVTLSTTPTPYDPKYIRPIPN
jgi:hypothetical protein